ncbi:hypothetical protein pipiens_000286, partial [Culex pipiens pipiens]
MPSQLRPVGVL